MSEKPAREVAGADANALRAGLARYFTPEELARLGAARVGIAGAGGLGSNVALMLARSGVEDMLIVDHDVVDASNLNRQQFWPRHVGRPKVEALGEVLRELNPHIRLELVNARLDEANLPRFLPGCPCWVEAFDAAESKTLLVEQALTSGRRIASASGVAGVGGAPMRRRRLGNLVLVGDFQSDVADAPPLAPRVTEAAALLADTVLEWILAGEVGPEP